MAAARFAPDDVSGYNVNTIALQVPIDLLTRGGDLPSADQPDATIGTYGSTSRQRIEQRRPGKPVKGQGLPVQVQRMGNPLFNELIIGTGFKDAWSRARPVNDADFADFALDPLIARAAQAAFGFDIPAPPRTDLLPLVTYAPPKAAWAARAISGSSAKAAKSASFTGCARLQSSLKPVPMISSLNSGLPMRCTWIDGPLPLISRPGRRSSIILREIEP
jgi:hypothetical protein